jgi:hypothetical protein
MLSKVHRETKKEATMTPRQKNILKRILLGALFFIAAAILSYIILRYRLQMLGVIR